MEQLVVDVRSGDFDPTLLSEDLEHIETSLQACRRIFSGMLAFARHDAQSVGGGNVRRAIDTTLSILADRFRQVGITVELVAHDEVPLVRGTQGDLEQIFLNLASNAVDAMPAGGQLTIQVASSTNQVRISVTDNGHGIAREHLQRIQEPFFTTKPAGNGLGLSVSRSVVWSMGGKIKFDSEVGVGTRVTVKLPVAAPPESKEER